MLLQCNLITMNLIFNCYIMTRSSIIFILLGCEHQEQSPLLSFHSWLLAAYCSVYSAVSACIMVDVLLCVPFLLVDSMICMSIHCNVVWLPYYQWTFNFKTENASHLPDAIVHLQVFLVFYFHFYNQTFLMLNAMS